jgi:hypothetical protein
LETTAATRAEINSTLFHDRLTQLGGISRQLILVPRFHRHKLEQYVDELGSSRAVRESGFQTDLGIADVKKRLIELWQQSLAITEKSRSWTAFSNLNRGVSKKAAYTPTPPKRTVDGSGFRYSGPALIIRHALFRYDPDHP